MAVVAAEQGAGIGIAAGVEGGVGQAESALGQIAEIGVEILEVDVRGEVERHRDTDLVQRRDRRRHVLRLLDRADTCKQRCDRRGAVAIDGGFVQTAGPEIAEQLLHRCLRRLRCGLKQIALLLLGACGEFAERADAAFGRDRVRFQPVRIGEGVKVGAAGGGGRRFRRRRCGLALFRGVRMRCGHRDHQTEDKRGGAQDRQGRHRGGGPFGVAAV